VGNLAEWFESDAATWHAGHQTAAIALDSLHRDVTRSAHDLVVGLLALTPAHRGH
jgi:hypothetical protein